MCEYPVVPCMEVAITLTDKELKFLQDMIEEGKLLDGRGKSLEEMVHECREMALFDEGEHSA
jgi:hypothetical protein